MQLTSSRGEGKTARKHGARSLYAADDPRPCFHPPPLPRPDGWGSSDGGTCWGDIQQRWRPRGSARVRSLGSGCSSPSGSPHEDGGTAADQVCGGTRSIAALHDVRHDPRRGECARVPKTDRRWKSTVCDRFEQWDNANKSGSAGYLSGVTGDVRDIFLPVCCRMATPETPLLVTKMLISESPRGCLLASTRRWAS